MERSLTENSHRLALLASRLDGLSPLKKLGGGYGFITDSRGQAMTAIRQAEVGSSIRVHVRDGYLDARVEAVIPVAEIREE